MSKRLLLFAFLTWTQHIPILIFKDLQLHHTRVDFSESKESEYFPLFVFLEHERLKNHAEASLPNGKFLIMGKQSVSTLSLFCKLTEPFLIVVLQRVLGRNPSLSPSSFSLIKLEVGQT